MPSQYNKNGGVWRTFIYYLTYVNMLTAFTIFNSTACRWCRCSTRRRNDSTLKIRYDAARLWTRYRRLGIGLKIYTIPPLVLPAMIPPPPTISICLGRGNTIYAYSLILGRFNWSRVFLARGARGIGRAVGRFLGGGRSSRGFFRN